MSPTNPLSPVQGETADEVRFRYFAVQQDTIQKGVENISANMAAFQLQYTKSHEQLANIVDQTKIRIEKVEAAIGSILPVVSKTDTIQQKIEDQSKDLATEIITRQCETKDLNDKIDRLVESIQTIRDDIKPLLFVNRIFVWIGAVLGTTIIAFLWAMLTHRVDLLFH